METTSDEDLKSDIDTMANLIVSLTSIKTKYKFKTPKFQKISYDVNTLIDKINNYIIEKNGNTTINN